MRITVMGFKKVLKTYSILTAFFLALLLPAAIFVLGENQTESQSQKGAARSDSAEMPKGKLSSEASEIRIDDEGIYLRTKEGKEFQVTEEGIIIDEEGVRIGDLKIDLEELEGLEIPPIKIPPIPPLEKTKKVYTVNHDIVKMGRDIVVEEYEEVDGNVVAIGGDITVKGTITGDVAAVGGDVFVSSTGVVDGDAVSVGGEVEKETGAVIKGERVGVSFFSKKFFRPVPPRGFPSLYIFRFPPFLGHLHGFALFARIIKILFFLFLGIVVISIVPKNVAKVKDKVRQDFLKSALVGFVAEILILPVFILLIVTIIGIPVALLVEPLLILVALILGYTGVSYFIGEKLKEGTSLKPDTHLMILVIGILALESVLLLARVVGIFGDVFFAFSWILTFIGWIIWYVAITVGFGASILTRLGTRPKEVRATEAPSKPSDSTEGDNKSDQKEEQK
jgi:hypothetical protein